MNSEKQIEEMAKDLCSDIGVAVVIVSVRDDGTVRLAGSEKYLKNLVDKGYRKADEVAREIFERLHAHLKYDGHTVSVWKNDLICIAKEYGIDLETFESDLRNFRLTPKKYTEGEE